MLKPGVPTACLTNTDGKAGREVREVPLIIHRINTAGPSERKLDSVALVGVRTSNDRRPFFAVEVNRLVGNGIREERYRLLVIRTEPFFYLYRLEILYRRIADADIVDRVDRAITPTEQYVEVLHVFFAAVLMCIRKGSVSELVCL